MMERHERFDTDFEASRDTGVSGPDPARSRSPWRGQSQDAGFDARISTLHQTFAVAASQILSRPIEAGFIPGTARKAETGIVAKFEVGGVHMARLSLGAGISDALMSQRFGGVMTMVDPVICEASRLVAMPVLDRLAEEFGQLWQKSGLHLVRNDGLAGTFAPAPFDHVLQIGSGALHISYAAGFGNPTPQSNPSASPADLGNTRISVSAVVAQTRVSLRRFATLKEGDVVPLGTCEGVTLMAGDRSVGTGVMISVGSQRGVRLESLFGIRR